CPSEVWVKRGSHCHLASCNTGDMQHAREQCSSFGATVASVHDVNEELFVEWLAMSEQSIDGISCGVNGSMYLGLTSNGIGWVWDDDSTFDFNNWGTGEPSDDSDSRCVVLVTPEKVWNDVPCNITAGYICKLNV
ncbi:hypothetical protein CAPTEDRAFT_78188, partial [Capitella teleta]